MKVSVWLVNFTPLQNFCLSDIEVLQTLQTQRYTVTLLSCYQHIIMERRRVNALAVHLEATPIWREE